MKKTVDDILRDQQSGFRNNKSCSDAIFTLRRIIESTLEYQNNLVINFIDFQKAFDSVNRKCMWKIVSAYNIPDKFVNIMKSFYNNSRCCLRLGTNFSDLFEIKTGVRQGCILSPFLFLLVIDYGLRKCDLKNFGLQWFGKRLFDLDFADDVALFDKTEFDLQTCTNEVMDVMSGIGLRFNVKKCMERHPCKKSQTAI